MGRNGLESQGFPSEQIKRDPVGGKAEASKGRIPTEAANPEIRTSQVPQQRSPWCLGTFRHLALNVLRMPMTYQQSGGPFAAQCHIHTSLLLSYSYTHKIYTFILKYRRTKWLLTPRAVQFAAVALPKCSY